MSREPFRHRHAMPRPSYTSVQEGGSLPLPEAPATKIARWRFVACLVTEGWKFGGCPRTARNCPKPALKDHIESGATLNTDEAVVYHFIGKEFGAHGSVNHAAKEYVKRTESGEKVTTNTVEGYFSTLKRGVHGVYEHVSRRHLHRYLSEFDFRYNARDVSDAERAVSAIRGTDGKRLTYRDSCARDVSVKKKP